MSQMGQGRQGSQRSQQPSQAARPSVYVTLLSRQDVLTDLAITQDEMVLLRQLGQQLDQLARNPQSRPLTDGQVRERLAAILTGAQMTRLQELSIQYLGYGSLKLTDVQSALNLTEDQKAQIQAILEGARQSRQSGQVSVQLGKVLTPEQDGHLRTMAGKPLGAGNQRRGGGSID